MITVQQAYRIIGVPFGSNLPDIERAYRDRLSKLQLQLTAGQPTTVRQNAQQQIAELEDAWNFLNKNMAGQTVAPGSGSQRASPGQAAIPIPKRQTRSKFTKRPNSAVVVSFAVPVIMLLLILLMCRNALTHYKIKSTAQVRVISVPWCYVEVDGKNLGPSGQASPFEIIEGRHTIKLKREGYLLTKNFKLRKGQRILFKAHLDKGIINVIQE